VAERGFRFHDLEGWISIDVRPATLQVLAMAAHEGLPALVERGIEPGRAEFAEAKQLVGLVVANASRLDELAHHRLSDVALEGDSRSQGMGDHGHDSERRTLEGLSLDLVRIGTAARIAHVNVKTIERGIAPVVNIDGVKHFSRREVEDFARKRRPS